MNGKMAKKGASRSLIWFFVFRLIPRLSNANGPFHPHSKILIGIDS